MRAFGARPVTYTCSALPCALNVGVAARALAADAPAAVIRATMSAAAIDMARIRERRRRTLPLRTAQMSHIFFARAPVPLDAAQLHARDRVKAGAREPHRCHDPGRTACAQTRAGLFLWPRCCSLRSAPGSRSRARRSSRRRPRPDRAAAVPVHGARPSAVRTPPRASARRCSLGLTISSAPNPSTDGQTVTISGRLAGPRHAHAVVLLWRRLPGQRRFHPTAATRTDPAGRYSITVRLDGNRWWYVTSRGFRSRTVHQRVQALITLAASEVKAAPGDQVTFTGQRVARPPSRADRVAATRVRRAGRRSRRAASTGPPTTRSATPSPRPRAACTS